MAWGNVADSDPRPRPLELMATSTPLSRSQQPEPEESQSPGIPEFGPQALANNLIQVSGHELEKLSKSALSGSKAQMTAIRNGIASFQAIANDLEQVTDQVSSIHAEIIDVESDTNSAGQRLGLVTDRMADLEGNVGAIDRLLKSIDSIADQTKLIALNATIEAATAGPAGRRFGVVAHEVKELSRETKEANEQIQDTLHGISRSITELAGAITIARKEMDQSLASVEKSRVSIDGVHEDTRRFHDELQQSLSSFHELEGASRKVESEITELGTIGETIGAIVGLLQAQGLETQAIDPLDRLASLVAASDFNAAERFTTAEPTYNLRDGEVLISATDTRGVIQYANDQFYKVAQYEFGELVGKPHNIIRHTDMPKTAFADLWAVIAEGKMWQGYVYNKGKLGRTYWVKAMVFPVFAHGQITGYISVRTQPTSRAIEIAKKAYRKLP